MRRLFAFLAAILTLLACPVLAEELRVLETPADIFGLEAVGRLDWSIEDRSGFCTGTLITPRQVLTAAHCVFGLGGVQVPPDGLIFRAGLQNGRAKAERRIRRVAVHPGFRPEEPLSAHSVASDLALLELESPLDYWAVPPLRTGAALARGMNVQVVSYAQGRDLTPSHEASCSVLSRQAGVLALDCQATFGASGSPVFVSTTRGLRIVSVISAIGSLGPRDATFAATVDGALDVLRQRLGAGQRPARLATPGVKTLRPGTEGASGSIRFLRPGE